MTVLAYPRYMHIAMTIFGCQKTCRLSTRLDICTANFRLTCQWLQYISVRCFVADCSLPHLRACHSRHRRLYLVMYLAHSWRKYLKMFRHSWQRRTMFRQCQPVCMHWLRSPKKLQPLDMSPLPCPCRCHTWPILQTPPTPAVTAYAAWVASALCHPASVLRGGSSGPTVAHRVY